MKTDFLFATPSFLTGMGGVLNLWGNYYDFNTSKTAEEADAKAIYSDFAMVYKDMSKAMDELLNEK